jgi:uncharacterized protein (DUF983 family)
MFRVLRVLYVTMLLRCPACQRGRMFRSLFQMNVRCPVCGVVFERDAGEVTGAMAINTALMSLMAIVGAVLAIITTIPTGWLIGGTAVVMIFFGVFFYRHARAVWVGVLFLTGAIFEDV